MYIKYPYQDIEDKYFSIYGVPYYGKVLLGYCTESNAKNQQDLLIFSLSWFQMKKYNGVLYIPFYTQGSYLEINNDKTDGL